MKTVLISGINGFLGSNLAKVLETEYAIVGTEYSLDNLFRLAGKNYSVFEADHDSITKIFKAFKIDVIIHTATLYGRDNEITSDLVKANSLSPLTLLEVGIKNKVPLFINTDTVLDKFTSAYSLTKSHFRDWLQFYSEQIKVVNLQLEHFYGPGCPETNFITRMIKLLKSNVSHIDLTTGEQKRDFVYYSDVVTAFLSVMNNIKDFNKSFSQFEVCTGNLISIKELLTFIKVNLNSNTELRFGAIEYRKNELKNEKKCNKGLYKLGWTPRVEIYDGLLATIKET
ncbi:MAG: NAD-dependent epimerase/dehydratase family protein [Ignavibacteriales bacterium]|nr:MAG: NAD-dependent epimerase/dehydratase family protein [Ignavibacteriales bacterium]